MARTKSLFSLMTSSVPRNDVRYDTRMIQMEYVSDGVVRHEKGEGEEYVSSATGEQFRPGDLVWVMRKGTSQHIIGSVRNN